MSGAISSETTAITLMRIETPGPDVSLNGSPTVSPTTAALWASEPLRWPSRPPFSIAAMRSAQDFFNAASKIGYTFNWFYTDDRDIGYINTGANPVRPKGVPERQVRRWTRRRTSRAGCRAVT